MKNFFASLALVALLFPSLIRAQDVTPVSGDLIKGSGSAVYYLGADNKRYVFPTEATYKTWYADFSQVKTISDNLMMNFALGGNVTYKPGARLIKITTDPKVYAVSAHGILRWISTETIAQELYGTDWAKKIDDLPDAFFVNYQTGATIQASANYSRNTEFDQATSINTDKNLLPSTQPSAPITPPTAPVTPVTSEQNVAAPGYILLPAKQAEPGQSLTVTALAERPSMLDSITFFLDNEAKKSCRQTPCGYDLVMPYANSSTHLLRAEFTWMDQSQYAVTTTVNATPEENRNISVRIGRPEIKPGELREIIAETSGGFAAVFLDIYLDNTLVKSCSNVARCTYSEVETAATGTIHTVYAKTTNGNANRRTLNTEFRVVDNPKPLITLTPGITWMGLNEKVDVTLIATDNTFVSTTEIWLDNQNIKTCETDTCTATLGPWTAARTLIITGKARDNQGAENSFSSNPIIVR